jgi:hypothetical protein
MNNEFDQDERMAEIFGMDVDQYLMEKARDRRLSWEVDEDTQLPF